MDRHRLERDREDWAKAMVIAKLLVAQLLRTGNEDKCCNYTERDKLKIVFIYFALLNN